MGENKEDQGHKINAKSHEFFLFWEDIWEDALRMEKEGIPRAALTWHYRERERGGTPKHMWGRRVDNKICRSWVRDLELRQPQMRGTEVDGGQLIPCSISYTSKRNWRGVWSVSCLFTHPANTRTNRDFLWRSSFQTATFVMINMWSFNIMTG